MEMNESVGIFAAIGTVGLLFFLAIAILMIISLWKIFEKAGKPGWAAIIPVYNTIVLLEITKKPVWWIFILLFVPVVNFIFAIMLLHALSTSFGKGTGFTLGLLFLGVIFYPILGFGSAEYQG